MQHIELRAAFVAVVAAAFHGRRQLVGAAERADKQRHKQRHERLGALHKASGLKVGAARLLRGHDLIRLFDERRDEAKRDRHHHRELMHRDLDLLERAQQALQTVRQADGRGRIREQERSHDQKRDAQHHRDGGAHTLDP